MTESTTPQCPECRAVLPWPTPFAATITIICPCGAPLKMSATVDGEGFYRWAIEGPPAAVMEELYGRQSRCTSN